MQDQFRALIETLENRPLNLDKRFAARPDKPDAQRFIKPIIADDGWPGKQEPKAFLVAGIFQTVPDTVPLAFWMEIPAAEEIRLAELTEAINLNLAKQ